MSRNQKKEKKKAKKLLNTSHSTITDPPNTTTTYRLERKYVNNNNTANNTNASINNDNDKSHIPTKITKSPSRLSLSSASTTSTSVQSFPSEERDNVPSRFSIHEEYPTQSTTISLSNHHQSLYTQTSLSPISSSMSTTISSPTADRLLEPYSHYYKTSPRDKLWLEKQTSNYGSERVSIHRTTHVNKQQPSQHNYPDNYSYQSLSLGSIDYSLSNKDHSSTNSFIYSKKNSSLNDLEKDIEEILSTSDEEENNHSNSSYEWTKKPNQNNNNSNNSSHHQNRG